jgi:Flp pilus assembly protein TadG
MSASVRERGQVLPFMAITMTVLMGFAGMAVDLGYYQYQQRQQQSATDAAAIAGAQALLANNTCPDQAAVQTAAQNDAAANGYKDGAGSVSVTAGTPASGPFSGDNCAVQVNVSSKTATWFSRIFGFSGAMATTATAVVKSSTSAPPGCVFVNGNLSSAGTSISAPGCSILVNGSITTSGGTINAGNVGYGGSITESGTTFSGAQPSKMLPAPNPCALITGCQYFTDNPQSSSTASSSMPGCMNEPDSKSQSGGSLALTPGSYGGLSLTGVDLTLAPGLYVFSGDVSDAGGSIHGTGVTIYQESGGFSSSGATDELTACTTSCTNAAVSGVLYFQPTDNSSASSFSGTSGTYNGLIYAPSANVSMSGAGSGYSIYVVGSANLAGSSFVDTPTNPGPNPGPTPAGLFIKNVSLAN